MDIAKFMQAMQVFDDWNELGRLRDAVTTFAVRRRYEGQGRF
jgi:hypothetical protein